jgi:YHS domain-containing protein
MLCPVTDEALGSMGEPIVVRLGERTIYVCCQACVNAVKRNPQRYLLKVDAELHTLQYPDRTPRQTTTPWGGQKACPITGEALGEMCEPIPMELGGRTIFVCCEPCVDVARRSPAKYLRRMDQEVGILPR